jgi:hypothetical protein
VKDFIDPFSYAFYFTVFAIINIIQFACEEDSKGVQENQAGYGANMVLGIKPHDKDGDHDAGHHKLIRNFYNLFCHGFFEGERKNAYESNTGTYNQWRVLDSDANNDIHQKEDKIQPDRRKGLFHFFNGRPKGIHSLINT